MERDSIMFSHGVLSGDEWHEWVTREAMINTIIEREKFNGENPWRTMQHFLFE